MGDDDLTVWLMRDVGGDVDPLDNVPGWYRHAACRGQWTPDSDPWFDTPHDAALAVCERCPVRVPCGEFAQAEGITSGVWGGMSPKGRRQARQDDRQAA